MTECKHCGSSALVYNQKTLDSYCEACGKWQESGTYCTHCDKELADDEVFEFDGEESRPYCQECYEELRANNE